VTIARSMPTKRAKPGYKLTPCGEIPRDWDCIRLGEVFAERVETGFNDLPLLAVTGGRGVVPRNTLNRRDSSNVDKSAYLRVLPGDIAYNTMRMWQGVGGLSVHEGIVSPAYTVCRPLEKLAPAFAPHLLKHPANIRLFHRHSQGMVDDTLNLKFHNFAKIQVALPPVTQQRRIASMLSDFDEALSNTQAVLEKKELFKTKLVEQLFRYGLDKSGHLKLRAKTKQSAIGLIPEHWSLVRVRDAGEVRLGRQRAPDQHSGKHRTPYLRVANVLDGFIDYSDVLSMDFTPEERKIFFLRPGDVLLNEGQSLELVGRSALFSGTENTFCFQNSLIRFRAGNDCLPQFAQTVFKRYLDKEIFQAVALQTTSIAHLGADRLASMWFPLPPVDEQRRIIENLENWSVALATEAAKVTSLERTKAEVARRLLTGELRVKA
jgi:restriction endonuclease S subunit